MYAQLMSVDTPKNRKVNSNFSKYGNITDINPAQAPVIMACMRGVKTFLGYVVLTRDPLIVKGEFKCLRDLAWRYWTACIAGEVMPIAKEVVREVVK